MCSAIVGLNESKPSHNHVGQSCIGVLHCCIDPTLYILIEKKTTTLIIEFNWVDLSAFIVHAVVSLVLFVGNRSCYILHRDFGLHTK